MVIAQKYTDTIFTLNLGIVPTVWYNLSFISLMIKTENKIIK